MERETKCHNENGKWVVHVKNDSGQVIMKRGCPNPLSYPRPYHKDSRLYQHRKLAKYQAGAPMITRVAKNPKTVKEKVVKAEKTVKPKKEKRQTAIKEPKQPKTKPPPPPVIKETTPPAKEKVLPPKKPVKETATVRHWGEGESSNEPAPTKTQLKEAEKVEDDLMELIDFVTNDTTFDEKVATEYLELLANDKDELQEMAETGTKTQLAESIQTAKQDIGAVVNLIEEESKTAKQAIGAVVDLIEEENTTAKQDIGEVVNLIEEESKDTTRPGFKPCTENSWLNDDFIQWKFNQANIPNFTYGKRKTYNSDIYSIILFPETKYVQFAQGLYKLMIAGNPEQKNKVVVHPFNVQKSHWITMYFGIKFNPGAKGYPQFQFGFTDSLKLKTYWVEGLKHYNAISTILKDKSTIWRGNEDSGYHYTVGDLVDWSKKQQYDSHTCAQWSFQNSMDVAKYLITKNQYWENPTLIRKVKSILDEVKFEKDKDRRDFNEWRRINGDRIETFTD